MRIAGVVMLYLTKLQARHKRKFNFCFMRQRTAESGVTKTYSHPQCPPEGKHGGGKRTPYPSALALLRVNLASENIVQTSSLPKCPCTPEGNLGVKTHRTYPYPSLFPSISQMQKHFIGWTCKGVGGRAKSLNAPRVPFHKQVFVNPPPLPL